MPQRQQKAKPPMMIERMSSGMKRDAVQHESPATSHIHQLCLPQWYSILMTSGWQMPMLRNTAAPIMIPLKFMFVNILI